MASIPKAARLIPYMLARLKLTKIEAAIANTGIAVDLYPKARPRMMFGAAPEDDAWATF